MKVAPVHASNVTRGRRPRNAPAETVIVPTYADVETHVVDQLRSRGSSDAFIANHASAFRGFMSFHGKSPDSPVDAALTTDFDECLKAYLNAKSLLGRKSSSLRTRGSQLRMFSRVARSIMLVNARLKFNDALETAMRSRGFRVANLARATGIPARLMGTWLRLGREPRATYWGHVAQIEAALGLAPDALASRCRWYEREQHRKSDFVKPRIAYRERMAELRTQPYRLRVYSERLRREWQDLLIFKTDLLLHDDESRLERWTLRPRAHDTRDRDWFATVGDQQSPTAENVFQMLTRFWGFLCMATPDGRGLSADEMSLAHVADADALFDYLKWHQRRMGEFNKSAISILRTVSSLIRPRTGFVWQRNELGERASDTVRTSIAQRYSHMPEHERWRSWCTDTHAQLRKLIRTLMRDKLIKQSRSTSEPIRSILQSASPISYLARALAAHDRAEPPRHHKQLWPAHCRDGMVWALLLATALRPKHIGLMTYLPDNSGNLYRRNDGTWALRFERELFKNFKGAAADRDYDVALPDSLGPRIETYLKEARVHLANPECPYFIRPSRTGNVRDTRPLSDETVYAIVRSLATSYIPESAGFGGYAFRHIIATDWLKTYPRDYMLVALILHDKLDTVVAEYNHLEAEDGMRLYAKHVDRAIMLHRKRA